MSFNRETHTLFIHPSEFSFASPSRDANPRCSAQWQRRQPKSGLQTTFSSPNYDLFDFECHSGGLPVRPTKLIHSRSCLSKESRTAGKSWARQPRDHLQDKFRGRIFSPDREDTASPLAREPESSSSQPSEPFSGTYANNLSPSQGQSGKVKRINSWDHIFTDDFYQKIEDFLDAEGLEIVDPGARDHGIRSFAYLKSANASFDDIPSDSLSVKSCHHSPKLINDNIITSSLLQRRACRSQGPDQGVNIGDYSPNSRPTNIRIFRHFNDDVMNMLKTTVPIEERNTPVMSRNNSSYRENEDTPESEKLKNSKGFRGFKGTDYERFDLSASKARSNLTKYASARRVNSLRSPPFEERFSRKDNANFSEAIETALSRTSSSPRGLRAEVNYSESNADNGRNQNGRVIRKSRFQIMRELI